MSRRAFTLIELMIVIAVLGVMVGWMFVPLQTLLRDMKALPLELNRQERISTAFYGLKNAFDEATSFSLVNDHEVILDGSSSLRIIRSRDGRELTIKKSSGEIRFHFDGGLTIGPFSQVGPKTIQSEMTMDNAQFPMFWHVGRGS